MSYKPRWITNADNRRREHERICEAIDNCLKGNFHAVPGIWKVTDYVTRYSLRTLHDNYHVTQEEYELWVKTAAAIPKPESASVKTDEDDG